MSSNVDPLRAPEEIRYQIGLTRRDIANKVDAIQQEISNRVNTVKEGARHKLRDITDELSVSRQTEKRPGWVFGASVGAGFLLSRYLCAASQENASVNFRSDNSGSLPSTRYQTAPSMQQKGVLGREFEHLASIAIQLGVNALFSFITRRGDRQQGVRQPSPQSGTNTGQIPTVQDQEPKILTT